MAGALNSGKMGAAGLDVVYTRPIRADNPPPEGQNCIITPISWAPKGGRQHIMDTAVEERQRPIWPAPPSTWSTAENWKTAAGAARRAWAALLRSGHIFPPY